MLFSALTFCDVTYFMAFAMLYTLSSAVQYIKGMHENLSLYIVRLIFIKVAS